jgi:hypothetical protein
MSSGGRRRGRPPAEKPTPEMQATLDFVRSYTDQHGYAPSVTEIASVCSA